MMFSPQATKSVISKVACALAVCVSFATADIAFAQRGGAGARGGRQRPGRPAAQPVGSKKTPSTTGVEPGSFRGQISNFELASDANDENLIGYLTIRPAEKGARTLKLQVRRAEEQSSSKNDCIVLGSHAFDPDNYADVLWKGLYCDVTWDWLRKEGDSDKKKPTIKQLTKLTFDAIPVEGKIEEVEGAFLTIKVRPSGGREWPDAVGKAAPTTPQAGKAGSDLGKTKLAVAKKLRVKIFEDVTTFVDAAKQPLDMADFAPDQQIEAMVVYGKQDGILVELQSLTAEERKESEQPGAQKPTGPNQPRPGGAQPRGGGRPRGR